MQRDLDLVGKFRYTALGIERDDFGGAAREIVGPARTRYLVRSRIGDSRCLAAVD